MNAANEVAVHGFLQQKIGFTKIINLVKRVMEKHNVIQRPDLETILNMDRWARKTCGDIIEKGV
jgi:1-deoxy-D-xylulose-5-phosphate reductoisomerase